MAPPQRGQEACCEKLAATAKLAGELCHSLHGDFDLVVGRGETAAHMPLATTPERGPWDDRHIFFF